MHNAMLIIPSLSEIASKHRNLTAPYYGSIYILNYNVITQSQGTTILFLHFSNRHAVYVLFGTGVFAALKSYVGSTDQLFYSCFLQLVYGFWCKAISVMSSTATEKPLA